MKRVFIVDDHTAIREGFKAILERSQRYLPDGDASSGEEALTVLERGLSDPELFIVDVSLPGMSGLELIAKLRRARSSAVVVVSMHRRFDYIAGAFRAGASAYVSKDAGSDCILAALDAAAGGAYYLDPASLKLFVDESILGPPVTGAGRPGLAGLSDRELEVLRLLSAGKRAEEIADSLDLSQKTVENHLSNITGKLGARDRFELYRIAARLEGV
ncbi:MAG TPA: response regulator transcription factor [Rectinemataceae bacterium]|nr:response regulator transcription factor [Rectinemataceae bacterium]